MVPVQRAHHAAEEQAAAAVAALDGKPPEHPQGALLARVFGIFVHSLVGAAGLLFLLNAAGVAAALHAQGHWRSFWEVLRGISQGMLVLLQNFLLPFTEAGALGLLKPHPQAATADVWGCWVPGMLSAFLMVTAYLALATVRWRRPRHALPYALCAAVFLVWQAQMAQLLLELTKYNELAPKDASGDAQAPSKLVQQIQQQMFKTGHDSWSQLYADLECNVTKRSRALPQLTCRRQTLEAKLLPLIVQEFCIPGLGTSQSEFLERVQSCAVQGQRRKLLPSRPGVAAQDSNRLYCRCWSALFDSMRVCSRWLMIAWAVHLTGVLCVIYVAVEPKLASMSAREQWESLGFAVLAVTILACKVTVFPDGLPGAQALQE